MSALIRFSVGLERGTSLGIAEIRTRDVSATSLALCQLCYQVQYSTHVHYLIVPAYQYRGLI